jgi:hypothetical protein
MHPVRSSIREKSFIIYRHQYLIVLEDQTPCQTYRFPRRWKNQVNNERGKYLYLIENREEVRDGTEVQEEENQKAY